MDSHLPIARCCLARAALLGAFLAFGTAAAQAAELHSASVDRAGERIIVRGAAFAGGTTFSLGGVSVPTANVTPSQIDLSFGVEIYNAVQWRGSYALVADGAVGMSLFIEAPIEEPPPPPPPPSGGPDCPCNAGWDATGINNISNLVLCADGQDGTQLYVYGSGYDNPWFFSAAWDPNNPFFDAVDPGNSISFCVAHDGVDYTVAEPVTNEDQYWNCYLKLWVDICL